MTELVNPAASQGINFGEILSQTLGAYQAVSLARIEKDTARYNAAGASQASALHSPQGYTMLESLGIGNSVQSSGSSVNPAARPGVPKALLWGGLALGLGFVAWKMVKR